MRDQQDFGIILGICIVFLLKDRLVSHAYQLPTASSFANFVKVLVKGVKKKKNAAKVPTASKAS